MDELDSLLDELERKIDQEERARYSARVIDHARNPRNLGRMERAEASAVVKGWCGDTMELYLRLGPGGRIEAAAFMTDGCGSTLACGSMLTVILQGKSIEEALRVSPQELIAALGGLPADSAHCAELAVKTLRAALANRG